MASKVFQWIKNFLSPAEENGEFYKIVYTFSKEDSQKAQNKGRLFYYTNFSFLLEAVLLEIKTNRNEDGIQAAEHIAQLNTFFDSEGKNKWYGKYFETWRGADAPEKEYTTTETIKGQLWMMDQTQVHELYGLFFNSISNCHKEIEEKIGLNEIYNLLNNDVNIPDDKLRKTYQSKEKYEKILMAWKEKRDFLILAEKVFAVHWNTLSAQAKRALMKNLNIQNCEIKASERDESLELLFCRKLGENVNYFWHGVLNKLWNQTWRPPRRQSSQPSSAERKNTTTEDVRARDAVPPDEICKMSYIAILSLVLIVENLFFWLNKYLGSNPIILVIVCLEVFFSSIIARSLFRERSLIVITGGYLIAYSLLGVLQTPWWLTLVIVSIFPLFGHKICYILHKKNEAWMTISGSIHLLANIVLLICYFVINR